MPVIHGGGCPDISFDGAASRPVGLTVEPKVCERCTRQFFRAVPAVRSVVMNGVTIDCGEKFCPGCRAKRVTRKLPQPARVQ